MIKGEADHHISPVLTIAPEAGWESPGSASIAHT